MYKPVSKKTESKVSCKYELASIVSKRARQMVDFDECNEEYKPVLQALEEFENDDLKKREEN